MLDLPGSCGSVGSLLPPFHDVVLPYVEGVTERVSRVLKRNGVASAMRPHQTLRRLLVHPKDKVEPDEQGELVYSIP